jgi:hypothetical protein
VTLASIEPAIASWPRLNKVIRLKCATAGAAVVGD